MTIASSVATSWWRTQGCMALSSAEAEFYAAALAVVEAKFVQHLLQEIDIGYDIKVVLKLDSSAAKAAIERHGSHRMKHIELKYYYLKQMAKDGEIFLSKVRTNENSAAFLTKAISGAALRGCMTLIGGWCQRTHASTSAQILTVTVWHKRQELTNTCATPTSEKVFSLF